MNTRVLAIIAILAVAAYAGTPSFSVCGSGTLANPQVSSPDEDWSSGSNVKFVIKGDLTAPITSGSKIDTVAYFSGTEVEKKSDDLCTYAGSPFTCPEAAGAKSWTFDFAIPSIPFSGKLTSHSDFLNADGSSILCLELSVEL